MLKYENTNTREKDVAVLWEQYDLLVIVTRLFQIEYIDLDSSKIGRVKLGVQQKLDSMFLVCIPNYIVNRGRLREDQIDCSIRR